QDTKAQETFTTLEERVPSRRCADVYSRSSSHEASCRVASRLVSSRLVSSPRRTRRASRVSPPHTHVTRMSAYTHARAITITTRRRSPLSVVVVSYEKKKKKRKRNSLLAGRADVFSHPHTQGEKAGAAGNGGDAGRDTKNSEGEKGAKREEKNVGPQPTSLTSLPRPRSPVVGELSVSDVCFVLRRDDLSPSSMRPPPSSVYYVRSSSDEDEDEDEDEDDDDHDDHDGSDESFDVEEASEKNREAEVKTRLLRLSGRGLAGGLGRGCLGPAP
ncbi:hypothetical protein ALC56_14358, partial [Trachymyrmex septentrionalis]